VSGGGRDAGTGEQPAPVLPLPLRGEWFADARDAGRALRASWHPEAGCVVLSTWRDDRCVGTTRLTPAEAARLVGSLAAALAAASASPHLTGDVESA
jgi:hypothetical protein